MARSVLAVLARATPGNLDEFRRWYDEVHIPELCARYPEILEFERHDVVAAPGQGSPDDPAVPGPDSVAIYVVQGDAAEVWSRMRADRTLATSPAFDHRSVRVVCG